MNNLLLKHSDINSSQGLLKEQKIQTFENLLISTSKVGVDKVVNFLRQTDFYTAPASTVYHNNYPGGLLDHCLSVYALAVRYKSAMIDMDPSLNDRLIDTSIVVASLLHDICKCSFYQPINKWKKRDDGEWENYQGYKVVDMLPAGHGEKSVIMLQYIGLELTVDEILAIRWHMGLQNDGGGNIDLKYSQRNAIKMCPLVTLIQMADFSSSVTFEKEIEEN